MRGENNYISINMNCVISTPFSPCKTGIEKSFYCFYADLGIQVTSDQHKYEATVQVE